MRELRVEQFPVRWRQAGSLRVVAAIRSYSAAATTVKPFDFVAV